MSNVYSKAGRAATVLAIMTFACSPALLTGCDKKTAETERKTTTKTETPTETRTTEKTTETKETVNPK